VPPGSKICGMTFAGSLNATVPADLRVHAQEAVQQSRVDDIAESLTAQPVHHLQDLAAPVERAQRFGLRRLQLVHVTEPHRTGTPARQAGRLER
jgi:hypothetical protein